MKNLPPGTIVAKLLQPFSIPGIEVTVRGLERTYGKGLVIGDAVDGEQWLVIQTPAAHAYARAEGKRVCSHCGRRRSDLVHDSRVP